MPVYMNLQLTGGAAHCVTTVPGGLLPRLFTLTACAAVIFCHLNPTVTRSFPLRNVTLCVARTFLSQPCDVNERQAAILFLEGTKVLQVLNLCKFFDTFASCIFSLIESVCDKYNEMANWVGPMTAALGGCADERF